MRRDAQFAAQQERQQRESQSKREYEGQNKQLMQGGPLQQNEVVGGPQPGPAAAEFERGRRSQWKALLVRAAAMLVRLYVLSVSFKTGIEIGHDQVYSPEFYRDAPPMEHTIRMSLRVTGIFVANVVSDFNRIVFQNLVKGNIPGVLVAVFDNMSPFSDSYTYSILGEPPPSKKTR